MEFLFALLLTFIAALTQFATPPPPPPVPPATCPSAEVLYVPGSSETTTTADTSKPAGLLAEVAGGVTADTRDVFLAYPATVTTPIYAVSENAGVQAGLDEIVSTHRRCPDTVYAIVGYSQGADVAGDLTARIVAEHVVPLERIVGVGLIADPKQTTGSGTHIGPPSAGSGVLGTRPGSFGDIPVLTFCATGDAVCASPNAGPAAFASVIGSKVHGSYDTYLVAPGQTATAYLAGWLNETLT